MTAFTDDGSEYFDGKEWRDYEIKKVSILVSVLNGAGYKATLEGNRIILNNGLVCEIGINSKDNANGNDNDSIGD